MQAEITNDTDPLRIGTAEGDGKSLKLFLAAEIVRIGRICRLPRGVPSCARRSAGRGA
jgi:hypothetical protein